jgi:hypothetical protein
MTIEVETLIPTWDGDGGYSTTEFETAEDALKYVSHIINSKDVRNNRSVTKIVIPEEKKEPLTPEQVTQSLQEYATTHNKPITFNQNDILSLTIGTGIVHKNSTQEGTKTAVIFIPEYNQYFTIQSPSGMMNWRNYTKIKEVFPKEKTVTVYE